MTISTEAVTTAIFLGVASVFFILAVSIMQGNSTINPSKEFLSHQSIIMTEKCFSHFDPVTGAQYGVIDLSKVSDRLLRECHDTPMKVEVMGRTAQSGSGRNTIKRPIRVYDKGRISQTIITYTI